ncbi:Retrovirus-related Pol polyprotein from transposon TNT 1-94 [Vitis vinifera]|uniref:Retrovirus-related Pol polyprotein from transposon TNT 1-94 n=1 Tax=Vitis vinifera TaxID=29760 RepID=A0A438G617_VITVI|nr:Retrovirus-related Pol polyprotein from transposon TNT 1-94 [Vitis vinifera]
MSIEEYLDHFNKIILDLENIDITVSDEDKAIASYINMKEAIMYGRDSLTFDEVQSILHARELQKQEESKEESGDGLNIRGRSEKEEKKDKNSKSRSKSKTKKFKCFICHKKDFKKDCPDKRQNTVKKTMNEGDVAVILDGYDNFKEADGGHVVLGNNKHCKILCIGTVRIKHYDGIERVLEDVRSIPELKRNLISLGMLDKSGYTFKSEPNSLRVEDVGITKLWHQRLGHISHRGLQELEKQGVLGNYKLTDLPFCEHCVFHKATRVKFSKTVHETQNQLDYLHLTWGPSRVLSIGGTSSGLSKVFWAEAAEIESIISITIQNPSRKWTGKAADYQHLKVFDAQLMYTPKEITEEIVDMEPKTYQEAINSNEADQWVKAIQEEMDSLRKNETWELVTKPKDRKLVGSKWVFKRKQGTLGMRLQAHEDLELDQLDVKTAFLHGELDELIYMQPRRLWGRNQGWSAKRILGMEIERDRSKRVLRLSQKSYISKVLSRFEMNNVKTVSTPLGQHFRLSITQAPETHEEKRFMERIPYASMIHELPWKATLQVVKWLFQYLAGTRSLGLVYGVFGGAVSWKANLQSVVALSTTEAEYMAMIEAVKEAI